MSEYRVIITETLKRAVTVEAESREEAEEAVRRQYQNSEHILVAEDFDGVSFSAQYPEQQVELPYGKMKELFRKAERAGTHVCGYITFKFDIMTHPLVSHTPDGGAPPYIHGSAEYAIAAITIHDRLLPTDPVAVPSENETQYELLPNEELEAIYELEEKPNEASQKH